MAVVLSDEFDAPTLFQLASELLAAESTCATGFLLMEAVTLIRCWELLTKQNPLEARAAVSLFVFDFYHSHLADQGGTQTEGWRWRSKFAVQLYELLKLKHPLLNELQSLMVRTLPSPPFSASSSASGIRPTSA